MFWKYTFSLKLKVDFKFRLQDKMFWKYVFSLKLKVDFKFRLQERMFWEVTFWTIFYLTFNSKIDF